MVFKVVMLFDKGVDCGVEVNIVKFFVVEVGYEVCQIVVMLMGGMGYVQEYYVECYLCEVLILCIVLVFLYQIMNFIVECVFGLFKFY